MKIRIAAPLAILLCSAWSLFAGEKKVELPAGVPASHICILGGTNIANALAKSDYVKGSFTIETKFGASPEVFYGEVKGVAFYHVPMHGMLGIDYMDKEAIRRAHLRTWMTFHLLGVTEVLGGATAGSINPEYGLGDWVVGDDFIDFNVDRPRSIATEILGPEGLMVIARLNPATDPEIDRILHAAAKKHGKDVKAWKGGVIAQAAGGRFETKAEIRMMRMVGCDLVTMMVPSEIAYARQVGINYGSIIGIVNPAEGLGDWSWDTLTGLYPRFHEQAIKIYMEAVPKVAKLKGKPRVGDALRTHPPFEESENE